MVGDEPGRDPLVPLAAIGVGAGVAHHQQPWLGGQQAAIFRYVTTLMMCSLPRMSGGGDPVLGM